VTLAMANISLARGPLLAQVGAQFTSGGRTARSGSGRPEWHGNPPHNRSQYRETVGFPV